MLPTIEQIRQARRLIADAAIRTPLLRLHVDAPCELYLKLENLQPIGAFKIRGAAAAMGSLPPERLADGVITASAGNMAQGVAWCARERGVPCTVLAPETTPAVKVRAIEALGGRVQRVTYDQWWQAFTDHAYPGLPGTFIHAFDDPWVMAGNGTIALEILEDLPDVDAVVTPWGGGGLTCGVGAALKELKPQCALFASEVQTGAPLAAALTAGSPQLVDYQPSFVDGIGSRTVFPQMLARAQGLLAGSLVASLSAVAAAVQLLAERAHVLAEGAGAVPVACALAGGAGPGKVVCVVSGGNIALAEVCALLG